MYKKVLICATLAVTMLVAAFPVRALSSEGIPYATYQYNYDGEATLSPHAYVPEKYLNAKDLGVSSFSGANDMKIASNGDIYIADTTHDRILIFSSDYILKKELHSFSREGQTDSLKNPTGIFVTKDLHLYICDQDNKRLLEFDADGKWLRSVGKPPEELLPNDYNFSPASVAVDRWGRIYLVSAGTTYGIMEFDSNGNFQSFLGSQKTTPSFAYLVWRMIFTKEQQERSYTVVPINYNNIIMDEDGFIYATSQHANVTAVEATILSRGTDGTYLPVKKLNFNGTDVLTRKGFFSPAGDISFGNDADVDGDYKGTSLICSVAIGENGIYTLVDSKRNKLFTYDTNGNLLYAFGDSGNKRGAFQSLRTACYYKDKLYALDSSASMITVFEPTPYGELIQKTIALQEEREYEKVMAGWKEILKENNGFSLAYVGMGDAEYRNGNYKEAMKYYRRVNDINGYSKAFSGYRKAMMSRYYWVLILVIGVLLFGISKLSRFIRTYNTRSLSTPRTNWDHLLYAFHILFHPFDGFWDIRYENRGSKKAGTIILLLATVSVVCQQQMTGYIFNKGAVSNLLSTVFVLWGTVALFCVSNWCLTTLTDGKGAMIDIYTTVCYSTTPLILFCVPLGLLSNVLTLTESGFLSLLTAIAYIWVGILLFLGMLVTHHYTLGKNILSMVLTIVGMMVLLFIGFLLYNLAGRMYTFVENIVTEISLRI